MWGISIFACHILSFCVIQPALCSKLLLLFINLRLISYTRYQSNSLHYPLSFLFFSEKKLVYFLNHCKSFRLTQNAFGSGGTSDFFFQPKIAITFFKKKSENEISIEKDMKLKSRILTFSFPLFYDEVLFKIPYRKALYILME